MGKMANDVFTIGSVKDAYEGLKDSMEVRVILHGIFGPSYQISKACIQQTYSVDKEMVEKAIGRETLEEQIFASFERSINIEAQDWFRDTEGLSLAQYAEKLLGRHEKCICKIKELGDSIVSKTMENLLTCDIHTGELQKAIEALCIRVA